MSSFWAVLEFFDFLEPDFHQLIFWQNWYQTRQKLKFFVQTNERKFFLGKAKVNSKVLDSQLRVLLIRKQKLEWCISPHPDCGEEQEDYAILLHYYIPRCTLRLTDDTGQRIQSTKTLPNSFRATFLPQRAPTRQRDIYRPTLLHDLAIFKVLLVEEKKVWNISNYMREQRLKSLKF